MGSRPRPHARTAGKCRLLQPASAACAAHPAGAACSGSVHGPVAAKSNTKLGGKVIGVVAAYLLCGSVGGVGGAFSAVNALSVQ